jgi:hypothetical protein
MGIETSPKVILNFHIVVAIDNYPFKRILARTPDSIRETPERDRGLPVVARVDRNWVSSRQLDDIPKFNEKMKQLFRARTRQQPRAKAASK